jgi:hypothetical protein
MANLLFSFRRLKQNKKKEKKTKIAYLAILWQRTYSLGCVCLCLFHVQLILLLVFHLQYLNLQKAMMNLRESEQVAHCNAAFCFTPVFAADFFLPGVESLLFHP